MVTPSFPCLSSGRSSSGRPVQLCVLHGGKVCGRSVRAPALFSLGVGGMLGPQRSSQQPLVVAVTSEPTALRRLSTPFPRCQLNIAFIFPWGGGAFGTAIKNPEEELHCEGPDTVEVMADSSGLVLVLCWCFYTRQKFNSTNFHLGNHTGSTQSVLFRRATTGRNQWEL